MIDKVVPEERLRALKTIMKLERCRNTHRAIKARLKIQNDQLTFIIDSNGVRKTGEEMLEAILHHNTSHFQQAR